MEMNAKKKGMRARLLAVMSLVAALVLAMGLAACGGGGGNNKEAFVGTWDLESISGTDGTSAEDIASMKALGFEAFLNLNEDGTAELSLFGEVISGTWADKSATDVDITIDGSTVKGKLEGDKLVMTEADSSMTFTKGAAKPAGDSQSMGAESTTQTASGGAPASDAGKAPAASAFDKPVVIADDNVCTITVEGMEADWAGDPGYNLTIVNKSDEAIFVSAEWGSFSVNDVMMDPLLGETVQPGKTAKALMWFSKDEVGGGVEALTKVEGAISVVKDSDFQELAMYDFSM